MSEEQQPDPLDDFLPDVSAGDNLTRGERTLLTRQGIFLEAFARLGNISGAARETHILRKSHYDWMQDATYAARFREAEKVAGDALVQEARRRALQGVDRPVFQGGRHVGSVTEYSDTLLMFLMKGAMPNVYRERYIAPDPDAAALDHGLSERQRQLLMDELDALEAAQEAETGESSSG